MFFSARLCCNEHVSFHWLCRRTLADRLRSASFQTYISCQTLTTNSSITAWWGPVTHFIENTTLLWIATSSRQTSLMRRFTVTTLNHWLFSVCLFAAVLSASLGLIRQLCGYISLLGFYFACWWLCTFLAAKDEAMLLWAQFRPPLPLLLVFLINIEPTMFHLSLLPFSDIFLNSSW